METIDHRALKSLAIAWLFAQRCRVVATEVTTAVPRWRVDAAGWREGGLRDESVAIECKQSRADFFRDDEQRDELVAERERLLAKRRTLEESRLKVYEPHLCRRDESLFSEAADWDFTASRDDGYRRVLLDLRRVDQRIHGQTKFCLMTRYRLADRLYILAPRGMLRPREIPEGWGLLEALRDDSRRTGSADAEPIPVRETVPAPPLASRQDRRDRFVRAMAIAASRAAYGHLASRAAPYTGIRPPDPGHTLPLRPR